MLLLCQEICNLPSEYAAMPRVREQNYRKRLREQKDRLRVLLELPRTCHKSQILGAAIKFIEKNGENKENSPQTNNCSQNSKESNSQNSNSSQLDFFHLLKASQK